MISAGGSSAGTNLNRLMDSMGFADQLGDIMGAALDARVGDNVGVARNLFDAFSPISTGTLDNLMAGGFGPAAFLPRPHTNYVHHFAHHRSTHYEREQISTFNMDPFGLQKGVMIDGKNVDIGSQGKGITPSQFESKLMGDPKLRATVEAQLGGRIVYDGKADGRITVARSLPHPCIPFAGSANQNVAAMLNRCTNSMGQQNVLQGIAAALQQALPGFNAAAILNNPNLSFDEQLSQLMQGFMGKFQEALMKKLQGLVQSGGVQPPRRKKKKKGIGGKLKKGLKGIKKGVSKFGKVAKGLGKGLMKGVFKTVTGGFMKGGLLKGLLSGKLGMIFQLGTGLLGGIVGGPIGSGLIGQLATGKFKPKNLLKAANPLNQFKMIANPKRLVSFEMHQAFGQVTGMFQIVNGFSRGIHDVQRQAITQILRF